MVKRRIFLIVLDSFGIGEAPDAEEFGDRGCHTLHTILKSPEYQTPVLERLGLFRIEGAPQQKGGGVLTGSFGRMQEASRGKDTTIGHWEIAGIVSKKPLPVYPDGFPESIIREFEKRTKRKTLCNRPYSGTEVIRDYGEESEKTGSLIVYTSADSVFQIAAHEAVVSVEELYGYCETARELLTGEHGVGRVIARPFAGARGSYQRTEGRHDFSIKPPGDTMLDMLADAGYETYGIGKIGDIFAGQGISHTQRSLNNVDGMEKTIAMLEKNFSGICFVNLVDFDMLYGHRNDIDGYARAAAVFDRQLHIFMDKMRKEDILVITADHGCDPGFPGTDHTREYTPLLVFGGDIRPGVNLGTRKTFADIAATVLDIMDTDDRTDGASFKELILI